MFEYVAYPALLAGSLAAILLACELFTNGIEWAGHKLDLSHGATGSVLAAVGTALPETSIPILALIAGNTNAVDVAVGAIAGAPFMLATLAMFVSGSAVFYYSWRGRRTRELNFDVKVKTRDLGFFIVIYGAAVLATFVHNHRFRVILALLLAFSYTVYMFISLAHEGEKGGELDELHISKYFRTRPHGHFIAAQVIASLFIIAASAHYFVVAVEHVSTLFGIPTLLLSLIVTPIATELPEKMNSVLWIREGKDTLALGNITGAMVFQASFPVAIGVAFTPWELTGPTMVSAIIALLSAVTFYVILKTKKSMPAPLLLLGGVLYLAFITYLLI